ALVSRFRSSHHCAAASFANFGIEGHYQLIDLVWLWFRSPHFGLAARMMRTSEPPHWDQARGGIGARGGAENRAMTKKSEGGPAHPPLRPATRLVTSGRDAGANHGFVNP